MFSNMCQAYPELSEFFKAVKNKRFWMIQFLNLLKPLRIFIIILLVGNLGIVLTEVFLFSKELALTLAQQKSILSVFQGVVLFALVLYLVYRFFFLKLKKDVDDLVVPFCKTLFKTILMYLVWSEDLNLMPADFSLNSSSYVFLEGILLILLGLLIIGEQLIRSVIKRKIYKDTTMSNWLVLVSDKMVTSYDQSTDLRFYFSHIKHSMEVRLKYSNQHFIFSEVINGKEFEQEEMDNRMNHLPKTVHIKENAVSLTNFKKKNVKV